MRRIRRFSKSGSCTCALRIIRLDLYGAVRGTSRGTVMTSHIGFQSLVQVVGPAHKHTSPAHPHDHQAPVPLTAPGAVAMAARDTAGPPARSTRDRSAPPPSLASAAATSWLTLSRALAQAVARADARRCEVKQLQSIGGSLRLTAAPERRVPVSCTPLLSVLMLVMHTPREIVPMLPRFASWQCPWRAWRFAERAS